MPLYPIKWLLFQHKTFLMYHFPVSFFLPHFLRGKMQNGTCLLLGGV
jgi:hypothetical protein